MPYMPLAKLLDFACLPQVVYYIYIAVRVVAAFRDNTLLVRLHWESSKDARPRPRPPGEGREALPAAPAPGAAAGLHSQPHERRSTALGAGRRRTVHDSVRGHPVRVVDAPQKSKKKKEGVLAANV